MRYMLALVAITIWPAVAQASRPAPPKGTLSPDSGPISVQARGLLLHSTVDDDLLTNPVLRCHALAKGPGMTQFERARTTILGGTRARLVEPLRPWKVGETWQFRMEGSHAFGIRAFLPGGPSVVSKPTTVHVYCEEEHESYPLLAGVIVALLSWLIFALVVVGTRVWRMVTPETG